MGNPLLDKLLVTLISSYQESSFGVKKPGKKRLKSRVWEDPRSPGKYSMQVEPCEGGESERRVDNL
jgi:hypothetical protein